MKRRMMSLMVGLGLALGTFAAAANPTTLPYDGLLHLNGVAVDGQVEMRFSLHDAADGGTEHWHEEWTQATQTVIVRSGRFKVDLGTHAALRPVVMDAGRLWVGIAVRPQGAAEWRPLGGRQAMKMFPYAIKTTGGGGAGMAVENDLNAGALTTQGLRANSISIAQQLQARSMNVAGNASGSSLTLTGEVLASSVAVSGTLSMGHLTVPTLLVNGVTHITGDILATGFAPDIRGIRLLETPALLLNVDSMRVGSEDVRIEGHGMTLGRAGEPMTVSLESFTNPVNSPQQNRNWGLRVNQTLTVTGDAAFGKFEAQNLEVNGQMNFIDCRFCVQFGGNGGNRYACVQMEHGHRSGTVNPSAVLNDGSTMKIGIVCDDGPDAAGAGSIL